MFGNQKDQLKMIYVNIINRLILSVILIPTNKKNIWDNLCFDISAVFFSKKSCCKIRLSIQTISRKLNRTDLPLLLKQIQS